MHKIILTILFIIISFADAFSTGQIPDLLILGKDTIYLQSFPLETLNLKIRPFKYENHSFHTTGCWRGYQAVWTIENSKLYLVEIIRDDSSKQRLNIKTYLADNGYSPKIENGKILADWYTANLEDYFKTFNRQFEGYNDKKCLFESHSPKKKKRLIRIESGIVIENKMK